MRSHKLVQLALALTSLLPAACATTRYSRGVVSAAPDGKARGGSSVEMGGLKVRVESLDYAKQGAEIPSLVLRFVFEPREIGYSFDPAQVTLRDANGRVVRQSTHVPGYRLVAPGSSFTIGFPVTLTKEARFELELGGLARGRARMATARFALARREGRSIDRMYWLEAIGVALAAPLAIASGAPLN
jgi:hypothetical protein